MQSSKVTLTEINQTITLTCFFSTYGNCAWRRNNIPLEITRRFSYIQLNGKNVKDCSIKIENTELEDFNGTWTCGNKHSKKEIKESCSTSLNAFTGEASCTYIIVYTSKYRSIYNLIQQY